MDIQGKRFEKKVALTGLLGSLREELNDIDRTHHAEGLRRVMSGSRKVGVRHTRNATRQFPQMNQVFFKPAKNGIIERNTHAGAQILRPLIRTMSA